MSLFRVRDFWGFDFEQLLSDLSLAGTSSEQESASEPARESGSNFVVSLANFDAIGKHDVFVCANLQGLLCILQVPAERQERFSLTGSGGRQPAGERKPEENAGEENRQLLLAQKLPFPVVDLKSGFFVSALRQSLAVLTFNRLHLYQVKRSQVDLVSGQALFSHELEELHKFELLAGEFATSLLVLESQLSRSAFGAEETSELEQQQPAAPTKGGQEKKKAPMSRQLQLPQRDNLLVQYTSQFLFSLLENKRVLAHFWLSLEQPQETEELKEDSELEDPAEDAGKQLSVDGLAEFVGSMPFCQLQDSAKGSSLVVSLSDQQIHSLPMEKLLQEAKQNIMKRVTLSLLHNKQEHQPPAKSSPSALAYDQPESQELSSSLIKLQLESLAAWSVELASMPLRMQQVRRRPDAHADHSSTAQILVMSRYHLDLFSAAGEHLWSQRFEAPLICLYSYAVPGRASGGPREPTEAKQWPLLLTMVCSDALAAGQSNLTILEEHRTVWSALLNCKPQEIFRASLSKMEGVVVSLDSLQLTASYLGTNQDEPEREGSMEDSAASSLGSLAELELIDKPLFEEQQLECQSEAESTGDHFRPAEKSPLKVDVKLEAAGQWPEVSVEASISVSSELGELLRNLSMSVEHDDLLLFEPREQSWPAEVIAEGVTLLKLGHIWPDRREPLKVLGNISIKSNQINLTKSNESAAGESQDRRLLPKSLRVNLYFRYNDSHRSLLHEDHFLLPLNLVANLAHLDYSSGLEQDLEDVLTNLNRYNPPYYVCDLQLRSAQSEFMEFLEEFLESDLLCRGLNSESQSYRQHLSGAYFDRRRQNTLENMSLLAQSLDCRLKFKNVNVQSLNRQVSEEQAPAVMVSIALEMNRGSSNLLDLLDRCLFGHEQPADKAEPNGREEGDLVWLHLSDISAGRSSQISEQLLRSHLREWHLPELTLKFQLDQEPERVQGGSTVLISVESKNPLLVLFVQNHLAERSARHLEAAGCPLRPMHESLQDAIEINATDHKIGSFVAINNALQQALVELFKQCKSKIFDHSNSLKKELNSEYSKLYMSTMTSLSMSKKLCNLPEEMQQYYGSLTTLTKQYQLRVFKILSDLERASKLEWEFKKLQVSQELRLMFPDEIDCQGFRSLIALL